jgi:hypothetical protein
MAAADARSDSVGGLARQAAARRSPREWYWYQNCFIGGGFAFRERGQYS